MSNAAVYRLKDRLFMHPWHRTDMGVDIAADPFVCLPPNVSNAELGKAVVTLLDRPTRVMPHPKDWKGQAATRLKAAGVKSERAFQGGARLVEVERTDGKLMITPTHNGGTAGDAKGFDLLSGEAITTGNECSAEEIGRAIRSALERCT